MAILPALKNNKIKMFYENGNLMRLSLGRSLRNKNGLLGNIGARKYLQEMMELC